MSEEYNRGQEESGIKIGDTVLVERRAHSWESGWETSWIPEMDAYVRGTYEVIEILPQIGVRLRSRGNIGQSFVFPYFVLKIKGGRVKSKRKSLLPE